VLRFTATERALHWGFALGYLLLLGSGLPLMMPVLRGWIRGYSPVIGLRLHLAAAVLWVVATLAVVLLGDRRRLRDTWRELSRLGPDDGAWLWRFPCWLVARSGDRARIDATVGRFNGGQKVNALFTALTSGLLLVTVSGALANRRVRHDAGRSAYGPEQPPALAHGASVAHVAHPGAARRTCVSGDRASVDPAVVDRHP
jgi:cytochrome b subunit of formate dehydrogenase